MLDYRTSTIPLSSKSQSVFQAIVAALITAHADISPLLVFLLGYSLSDRKAKVRGR